MEFYKPNPSGTGHLIGLTFNSKEHKLYAEFVKQTSWNGDSRTGSFKGGAKIVITFSEREIGVILNCVERNIPEKLFHKAAKGSTSIEVKPSIKGEEPANGILINVNPRANEGEDKPASFSFWFDRHEARILRSFLEDVLKHYFAADYSEEKKRRAEYVKGGKDAAPATGF